MYRKSDLIQIFSAQSQNNFGLINNETIGRYLVGPFDPNEKRTDPHVYCCQVLISQVCYH